MSPGEAMTDEELDADYAQQEAIAYAETHGHGWASDEADHDREIDG